jgi:hypothetical protein
MLGFTIASEGLAHMDLTADDRLAIHELISLHGHLADDRGSSELDRFLTSDAVYDVEDFGLGAVRGLADIARLWDDAPGEQPVGHHVTNVLVTEQADGSVRARSKGLAVMANGMASTVVYDDVVVRTPSGWRVAYRKVMSR